MLVKKRYSNFVFSIFFTTTIVETLPQFRPSFYFYNLVVKGSHLPFDFFLFYYYASKKRATPNSTFSLPYYSGSKAQFPHSGFFVTTVIVKNSSYSDFSRFLYSSSCKAKVPLPRIFTFINYKEYKKVTWTPGFSVFVVLRYYKSLPHFLDLSFPLQSW